MAARGLAWEEANTMGVATQRSRPDGTPSPPFGRIDWLFTRGLGTHDRRRPLPAVDEAGAAISDHEVLAVDGGCRLMRLVTYNIQYGLGQDGRYDLARIAAEVAEADVIALQEVDRFWQRSGMVDAPAELGRHLPGHHWVFGANLDMDADVRDAEGRVVHRRRQFGTMILSRSPILSSRNHLLPKYGTLTQHSIQQGTLEAVIEAPFGPLRVYSVHLSHLDAATRLPQVAALLDIHRRAPGEGGAWCGGHPDPSAGWTEGAMPPMPRDADLHGRLQLPGR